MNQIIPILIILFSFVSCKQNNKVESREISTEYELIQIQFFPAFHSLSMLTYDLNKNKILFQRIGTRDKFDIVEVSSNEEKIVEIFSPKTSYYIVDSLNSIILKDSILKQFTEDDFKDKEIPCNDGILTTIIITKTDNIVKDIELSNSKTPKQNNLILKLIEVCQINETDSLNLNYLKELEEYF